MNGSHVVKTLNRKKLKCYEKKSPCYIRPLHSSMYLIAKGRNTNQHDWIWADKSWPRTHYTRDPKSVISAHPATQSVTLILSAIPWLEGRPCMTWFTQTGNVPGSTPSAVPGIALQETQPHLNLSSKSTAWEGSSRNNKGCWCRNTS